jgi:hypothetical protein
MTSPAVAPDISSCHQAAILTAASRLVAGLSPRAPELSSRPVHARLLWTARHRNRFLSELHVHLVSVIPLLLHAHSSVPPPRCTAEQYERTAQRSERRRLDVRGILNCVCIYIYIHTHTNTLLSGDMPHMYLCPSPVRSYIVFSQLKCHKSVSSDKFIVFQTPGVFV